MVAGQDRVQERAVAQVGLALALETLAPLEVGEGEGGKNEDDEYFDLLPNI